MCALRIICNYHFPKCVMRSMAKNVLEGRVRWNETERRFKLDTGRFVIHAVAKMEAI